MQVELTEDQDKRLNQIYLDAHRLAKQSASQHNDSLAALILNEYLEKSTDIATEILQEKPNEDITTLLNSIKNQLKLEIDEGIRYSV